MRRHTTIQQSVVAVGLVMVCLGSIRIALGEELEEITVTAQKREQSSQDVPLTISTLSGAELSKANIRDLFQIADHVPGMVFSRAPDDGMALTFRGLGTPARSFFFEDSIAIFMYTLSLHDALP